MGSTSFEKAAGRVFKYETTNGTEPVQYDRTDKGNWVKGVNVGTAHGISGKMLHSVYYKNEKYDDGTPNPNYKGNEPGSGNKVVDRDDINKLTPDAAKDIMYHNFWQPIHGDELNAKLAVPVLDSAFHNGPHKAIAEIQANLAVAGVYDGKITGKMNPATISAINSVDPGVMYNYYHDVRIQGYVDSNNGKSHSFVNRINEMFPKEPMTPSQQTEFDKLSNVREFQGFMNDQFGSNLKVDGIFGDSTRKALDSVTHAGKDYIPLDLKNDYQDWRNDKIGSVNEKSALVVSTSTAPAAGVSESVNSSPAASSSNESSASISASSGASSVSSSDSSSSSVSTPVTTLSSASSSASSI